MNTRPNEFEQLVNRAMIHSNLAHMRDAVEKELLIYDILFCLDQNDLLNTIVFQGGTLLRLGHGGSRLSEDLDFVAGVNFSASDLKEIKPCIEKFIAKKYGLTANVNEPSETTFRDVTHQNLKVNRWRISIATNPDRKDLPHQRLKLEIANAPAYTREVVALKQHYEFLPDGYSDTLIVAETLNEVMADKLISLPATTQYARFRDIWDLCWLVRHGSTVDCDLVAAKVSDYQANDYETLLNKTIEQLTNHINGKPFMEEMRSLLPTDEFIRTLDRPKFIEFMTSTLCGLFEEVRQSLYG